ncbi:SDR family oxidoreductase [Streptomyces sp. NPDC058045]|uniref:SDR family oxidoreductase n=1 Tax=Streptomyces sp. NPDC058045 TaxID=3346311 RepID=UPI0036E4FE7B
MSNETDTATSNTTMKGPVLVLGASGSIGRHVVAQSLEAGFETRALVRDPGQVSLFPEGAEVVVGDPTDAGVLAEALDGTTGVVFTQGTYSDADAEQANYWPVKAVLDALKAPARIALMTALGVTKPTPGHDWKRRGERLVRASGLPYTIVRPGWFDYNEPDEQRLVLRQGDTHWAGNSSDGVVSRKQIAQTLIASLTSEAADHKTFELVAEKGGAQADLDLLFAALQSDADLDGPLDRDNLPLDAEPQDFLGDLDAIRNRF